jgi:hypothetical protein
LNLGASAIVLRPRGLGEILDLACRLCGSIALRLYAWLGLAVLAPCFAACLALRYGAGWSWAEVWCIAIVLAGIAQGAYTIAVGRFLFSEGLGVREVLAQSGRRLGSYLGMLFVSRSVILLSASILVGPLLAWPRLLYVHEASLLEGAAPVDAVQRSSRFVARRVALAFGVLVALLLAQAGIVVTAELLGQGLVDDVLQLGAPFGKLFSDGGSPYALAGFFLSVPYVATARFLAYVDARTRADGWDIQVRFLAIAAREERGRVAA